MLAAYIMTASLGAVVFLWLLFRAESLRGQRYFLAGAREKLDIFIQNKTATFSSVQKLFGASALRLFFHFLLHQVLSLFLFIVRFVEDKLHRLRTKNKVVAKVIQKQVTDNHLTHIARHKEEVALSEEERERRKEESLHN